MTQLYVGLTEAMTNVVQHAYSFQDKAAPRSQLIPNRWWITGRIDRSARTFTFAICDLGIGIPKTIAGKATIDEIKQLLNFDVSEAISDGDLLRIALLSGETSTDLPYRGRGLKQMRGVVDKIGGTIQIASGFATCSYKNANFSSTLHQMPIFGTLIEWVIPLDSVIDRTPNNGD